MDKKRNIEFLTEKEVENILSEELDKLDLDKKRVIVLTPDASRSSPMPLIFKSLVNSLMPRVAKLDFLIALGTHRKMTKTEQNKLFGITRRDRGKKYSGIDIYNHNWDKKETFKQIGVIPSQEVENLSEGRLKLDINVSLNRLIFNYDHIIIYSPVFPHEVAGFSGGNKYFFPGIAGQEIINLTHWLGALITSYEIIGRAENPVRAIIERAADMIKIPVTGICAVVKGENKLAGLFVGAVRDAWASAVKLSRKVHINWVEKPYKLVISVMPEIYDELWTAAKGMYKVEPVVEDGGEVIIYAPHIKEVSYTHRRIIERIGYHTRDYFLANWDKFKNYPLGVLAHSSHLRGIGSFENNVEKPRIRVTLATAIPEEKCEKLSLGYRDPKSFSPADYAGLEDKGILVVWRAGEELYRLNSQKEKKGR